MKKKKKKKVNVEKWKKIIINCEDDRPANSESTLIQRSKSENRLAGNIYLFIP